MYIPSAAPWSTTFVSPGDDRNARSGGGFCHVGDDLAERFDREALLENEGRRECNRAGSHHRQVVDGAMHGEMTHRSPGKRSGLTTYESVLNASRSPEGSASTAASVWAARRRCEKRA